LQGEETAIFHILEYRINLADEFSALLAERDFLEALPGHMLPDVASQRRIRIVVSRMQQIIGRR
jgi:hypothetical protein